VRGPRAMRDPDLPPRRLATRAETLAAPGPRPELQL